VDRLTAEHHTDYYENKTNYLIPEGTGRFHHRGHDMFNEYLSLTNRLAPLPGCYSLPHYSIVTKASESVISG